MRLQLFVAVCCCIFSCVTSSEEPIRGVNFGGWLVLEPWITPSVFEKANAIKFEGAPEIKDQYTLCQILGPDDAKTLLQEHWETWVTEAEVQELAAAGITHVRIPVGYWLVDIRPGEPWVAGGMPELLRALGWIRDAGMVAMIDLHGAPGSQNGFDNSGVAGPIHWDTPDINGVYGNVTRSVEAIDALAEYIASRGFAPVKGEPSSGVVTAIELVNEPFVSVDLELIKSYYYAGYDVVHEKYAEYQTIIHGAFRLDSWYGFMNKGSNYSHVALDTHVYHAFQTGWYWWNEQQHLNQTCFVTKPDIDKVRAQELDVYVGEWSLAVTDCARWLNGYNTGARYEGKFGDYVIPDGTPVGDCAAVNDYDNLSEEYKAWLRRFAETQMDAYETSGGWYFWNFKAEEAAQWNFLKGLRDGYIPNPVTNRTFSCADTHAASAEVPLPDIGDEGGDKGGHHHNLGGVLLLLLAALLVLAGLRSCCCGTKSSELGDESETTRLNSARVGGPMVEEGSYGQGGAAAPAAGGGDGKGLEKVTLYQQSANNDA